MARRKYPSELNTRQIRVNVGDWLLLMELARQHDTTVAKVLHLVITKQAQQKDIAVPRTQIPMPVFHVAPQPTFRVKSQPVIAVNGNKAGVFVIKPKGGVINA